MFTEPFALSLGTEGREEIKHIRFTLDGSAPTKKHGSVYKTPFDVSKTMVLRAAAVVDGQELGDVATHSFIFVKSTLNQGDRTAGISHPMKTAMDSETRNAFSKAELEAALRALPIVSMTVAPEHLFEAPDGIYVDGNTLNKALEYPGALEFIWPAGSDREWPLENFGVLAGWKVQGGVGRDPSRNHKHSFSALFQDQFGNKKFRQPIMRANVHAPSRELGCEGEDRLIFRSSFNTGWGANTCYPRGGATCGRDIGIYARDQLARQLQFEIDDEGVGNRGLHVHLFVGDGLYMGVYEIVSRPADKWLSCAYGGIETDYWWNKRDGGSGDNPQRHQDAVALSQRNSNNGGVLMTELEQLFAMDNFVGSIILEIYLSLFDKQQYRSQAKTAIGRYRTHFWDAEITWDYTNANTDIEWRSDGGQEHNVLHNRLIQRSEAYKYHFYDRLLWAVEGPLATKNVQALFAGITAPLSKAMKLESLRWNAEYARGAADMASWRDKVADFKTDYIPPRNKALIPYVRDVLGWYPAIEPPVVTFVRLGGTSRGATVTIAPVGGLEFKYTQDGQDPRISGSALSSTTKVSFDVRQATLVRARSVSEDGNDFSADPKVLATVHSTTELANLRVSEIHYNPESLEAPENPDVTDDGGDAVRPRAICDLFETAD